MDWLWQIERKGCPTKADDDSDLILLNRYLDLEIPQERDLKLTKFG